MIHVEDELAIRAKDGDPKVTEEVWQKSKRLRKHSELFLPPYLRDDWRNETFFIMLRAIQNFDPSKGHFDSYFSLYLFSYKKRVLKDKLARHGVRQCPLEDITREFEAEYLSVTTPSYTIPIDVLNDALGVLSSREREIVVLYFGLEGHNPQKYETIGEIVGSTHKGRKSVSRQRVEQILSNALAKLKVQVALRRYSEDD